MNEHRQEIWITIWIAAVVILCYLSYFGIIITLLESLMWKVLLGIVLLVIVNIMVYVCIQRINEIKSGEEDELDRY